MNIKRLLPARWMRFPRTACGLAAVLVAIVCAQLVRVDAAVRPPRMQYQVATLPNGLTVVLSEDHSTPIVHSELWYHVGSKDERAGRTGFAHFFEHMMFKGSKNVGLEETLGLVTNIGGQANAYTSEDTTVFWETVPSQYLPLVLWLEADRMATLRIERATFEAEREVVKEERRLRFDNQPYGRLSEIVSDSAFAVSPYKHATIGSMADLDAASVSDLRDFYNTYYVPGNATLALVGDFDPAQALELVRQYFGRVPKSERPISRDYPQDPPGTAERRVTMTESWPLPAVVVAYRIPHDGHPDSYPLHIASKILGDGNSSRIYRSLVYDQGIAVSAFSGGDIIEEPNLFFAVALVQPGHTPAEAEKALLAEFDRLRAEPIAAHELERAQNQFLRDYILTRETVQGKALQLAHAIVIHHDVTTADGEIEIFMGLKPADVQRVARSYFTPENRLVVTILSGAPGAR